MISLIRHIKSEINCYFLLYMYVQSQSHRFQYVQNNRTTYKDRDLRSHFLFSKHFCCVFVYIYTYIYTYIYIYKLLKQRGHCYLFFPVFCSHIFVSFPDVFCVIFTSYFLYLFFSFLHLFLLSFVSFSLTHFVSVR